MYPSCDDRLRQRQATGYSDGLSHGTPFLFGRLLFFCPGATDNAASRHARAGDPKRPAGLVRHGSRNIEERVAFGIA